MTTKNYHQRLGRSENIFSQIVTKFINKKWIVILYKIDWHSKLFSRLELKPLWGCLICHVFA